MMDPRQQELDNQRRADFQRRAEKAQSARDVAGDSTPLRARIGRALVNVGNALQGEAAPPDIRRTEELPAAR